MKRVKQVMTKGIMPASPSDTVALVARKLTEYGIEAMPVCREGRFLGVITGKDIIMQVVATGHDPNTVQVESLMSNHIPRIQGEAEIVKAARLMAGTGVHYLPVVNNTGRFTGMITLSDLVSESLALASMVLAKTSERELNAR